MLFFSEYNTVGQGFIMEVQYLNTSISKLRPFMSIISRSQKGIFSELCDHNNSMFKKLVLFFAVTKHK